MSAKLRLDYGREKNHRWHPASRVHRYQAGKHDFAGQREHLSLIYGGRVETNLMWHVETFWDGARTVIPPATLLGLRPPQEWTGKK